MSRDMVVVAGAGGFIGGHLVSALLNDSWCVRGVDIKPLEQWWQTFPDAENRPGVDLRLAESCQMALDGARGVCNLAADMGGIGFIENHKAACMTNVLINTHLLQAAIRCGVRTYFFASSACVYAAGAQSNNQSPALKESDAYPAMPEDGYGWEKLFSERMCRHFHEDFGLRTRVARFHNVYGPHGTWRGGREKAPAAICRKVIEAKLAGSDEIAIWGDGEQTRSFMYVDDCILGVQNLVNSEVTEPLNFGSAERVSINQLVSIVEGIAGVTLKRVYLPNAPKGVAGRSSDNTLVLECLGWEPVISLQLGLERTYAWIYNQMRSGDGL